MYIGSVYGPSGFVKVQLQRFRVPRLCDFVGFLSLALRRLLSSDV